MAEYCDTLQSKEKSNWEHNACLNNRALRLLDQGFRKKSLDFESPQFFDFVDNQ